MLSKWNAFFQKGTWYAFKTHLFDKIVNVFRSIVTSSVILAALIRNYHSWHFLWKIVNKTLKWWPESKYGAWSTKLKQNICGKQTERERAAEKNVKQPTGRVVCQANVVCIYGSIEKTMHKKCDFNRCRRHISLVKSMVLKCKNNRTNTREQKINIASFEPLSLPKSLFAKNYLFTAAKIISSFRLNWYLRDINKSPRIFSYCAHNFILPHFHFCK